jgi:hypothetical protein
LLGSNNSGIVVLTEVSTVTTKGSLRSNGRRYKKEYIRNKSVLTQSPVKTVGIQQWPRIAELSSIELLGQKPRDIASDNDCKVCKGDWSLKIR